LINRYCCYPTLIDLSPFLHGTSKLILGEERSNRLVENTVGKVFTGGKNLKDLEKCVKSLNRQNIGAILNISEEHLEG